jgi:predicted O-linked N-acetylglucosamine transferase (SPINDLY family)
MSTVRQMLDLAWRHFQRGERQQAEQVYLQILQADPNQVDALNLLGVIAGQTGRTALAIDYLRAAVRLKPDFAAAYNNLGNAFINLGKLSDAAACFRQAVRVKPDDAMALNNLGHALRDQGELDEAVACLQESVRLRPDPEAYINLGNAFQDEGRLDAAITAFRAALKLKPDAAHIDSNVVFVTHYLPTYDSAAILKECQRWNQQHAERLREFIRPHANLPHPERRLRVGYVSPDFRDHVDSFFTVPLLSRHDHRQFEIFCYADVAQPDALTERLRGYADVWRSTVGLSDDQLADMIRGDRIDVLVDLKLHSAHNRLLVFARKPAPIQVTWLGYPGTTGLSTMDYRLTDPYLDPPGLLDAFYSEESIRLPDTYWCYDPRADQTQVNALPAHEKGFVTFGCLNNFCKVNDGCLALWAEVLHTVPRARLVLLVPRGQPRTHVIARFEQAGIAAERLDFADRQPRLEYLKAYHRIDVGLDPLPCNGGTTTLDALWMGVPTVTLLGKTVVGRAGYSQLCNLGLEELAAKTQEQYVALAARLAADLPRLQELRSTMRQRMLQSPLLDADRFARNMEHALRQMWRRWCRQKTPVEASTEVSPDRPVSGRDS